MYLVTEERQFHLDLLASAQSRMVALVQTVTDRF
jgi:hypothetical protein